MNRITVQDIADKLGLSRNTVSKALNGKPGILPETQEMILETAKAMGYYKFKPALLSGSPQKNAGGQDAPENHRMILLLTTKGKYNPFWDSMASGVYEELSRSSYSFIYGEALVAPEGSVELPSVLSQGIIDGIVVINVYQSLLTQKISTLGIPTVYYDSPPGEEPIDIKGDILVSDGVYAMRKMVKHLLLGGAEKICFIGAISAGMSIYDRWMGFVTAHQEMDRSILPELCLTKDSSLFLRKENVETAIGRLPLLPDAFVCANDDIAHAVIQYLQAKGIQIPRDVKVCGYDDLPASTLISPHLTSAKVSNKVLGQRVAQELLERIKNPEKPLELVRIYPEIKFRESTEF